MLALGSCSGGISRYRHPCVTAVGSGGERGGTGGCLQSWLPGWWNLS